MSQNYTHTVGISGDSGHQAVKKLQHLNLTVG